MTFCPSCGCNITADKTVEMGDWTLEPYRTLHKGQDLKLKAVHAIILHTVAASHPRPVRPEALANRISDAGDPVVVLRTQISQLKRQIADIFPVRAIKGCGYVWDAA